MKYIKGHTFSFIGRTSSSIQVAIVPAKTRTDQWKCTTCKSCLDLPKGMKPNATNVRHSCDEQMGPNKKTQLGHVWKQRDAKTDKPFIECLGCKTRVNGRLYEGSNPEYSMDLKFRGKYCEDCLVLDVLGQ